SSPNVDAQRGQGVGMAMEPGTAVAATSDGGHTMPVTVDATDQLLALTAGMFPEVVGVAALHTGGEIPALMGGELGPAASMAPQRLRESAAGRAGARQAMARLGLTPVAIPVQPGRAPEWPAAVC